MISTTTDNIYFVLRNATQCGSKFELDSGLDAKKFCFFQVFLSGLC